MLIQIQCPECGELLYNIKFTHQDAIKGGTIHGEDFKPIGKQLSVVDGGKVPNCYECNTMWCGYDKEGKYAMGTTDGWLYLNDLSDIRRLYMKKECTMEFVRIN